MTGCWEALTVLIIRWVVLPVPLLRPEVTQHSQSPVLCFGVKWECDEANYQDDCRYPIETRCT
jgi:hypothetical protein